MHELLHATFIKRYKRFFADVKLPSGEIAVAHVPNTGSMKSCLGEGWSCYLSYQPDPKRKLHYTLEVMQSPTGLIGVNTHQSNKIVEFGLKNNLIPELKDYQHIQSEYSIENSRFDFYLNQHPTEPQTILEIKNVTLSLGNGQVTFPDAETTRGQKHLRELITLKKKGFRTVLLFLIQREDATRFMAFQKIDLKYATLLKEANENGVEILCYQTKFNLPQIMIHQKIKIDWTKDD